MQRWPKAVVFDLDGTLVDSAPDIAASLNAALATEGLASFTTDAVKPMVGGGARVLIARALAVRALPEDGPRMDRLVAAFEHHYSLNPCTGSRLFPGATEVLRTLAGRDIGLGLCTNKPTVPTHGLLAALGVAHCFGAVVAGSDGLAKKPDPAMLEAVLQRLGVLAEDSVMVGDSAADVGTARNAGCPVVLVSFGYTPIPAAQLGGDAEIDALDALIATLDRLRVRRGGQVQRP